VDGRRVACRALAGYLARRSGQTLGDFVGYAVRFDKRWGDRTRVVFVTPGVALSMLASGELEDRCHTLMLDEFHERSAELDLLACAAQGLAARSGLRLVLCSATLESSKLAARLDGRVIESAGRSYPVAIRHEGEGGPREEELETRVHRAVERAIAGGEGDVLVFLPGRGEIRRCAAALATLAKANEGLELVEVHGGIAPDRLARAFEAGGGRRVYLSTNVAESSVTLPGVRCVIDTGLARRIMHRAGRSLLALTTIAQDAADQRAGRAGRVAAGECWRLWGSDFRLEPTTPPELEGIELDDLVLRAAGLGLAGDDFDQAPWISSPPEFAVAAARSRLQETGVLDDAAALTERGRLFLRLPVSAARAALLLDAPEHLRPDLADIVARVEVDRSLVRSGGTAGASSARADLLAGASDEVEVELVALRAGDGRRHGLDMRTLTETRRVAMALRKAIGANPVDPTKSPPKLASRAALVQHVLERAPSLAFVRRPRSARKEARPRRSEAWANDVGTELDLYPFQPPVSDTELEERPEAEAAIVFSARWLGVGRRARGVGELVLPVELSALRDSGLGTLEVGTPRIKRRGGSVRIEATSRWRFATLERESAGGELQGEALRQAAATLLARGALYPDLLPRLEAACLHRDLLARLPPFAEDEDPTRGLSGVAWLNFRLTELGLSRGEDFALLEVDDLLPDLDAWLGRHPVDPKLLADLRADFPIDFVDRGARYRVARVDLSRRRVVIEPANASAKKRGEPAVKLLPRYRAFNVFFEQASRKLKLR
jgi:ATP-dependent helicase HrpB